MKTKKQKTLKRLFIVLIIIVVIIASSFVAAKLIYDATFPHFDTDCSYFNSDSYPCINLSFESGENKLQAYLYGTESNSSNLIVIAPGLGSCASAYDEQIKRFVDNGWQVFAYDGTGTGESDGDSTIGVSQSYIDLNSALTYIKSSGLINYDNIFLFGHSLGGYAACNILSNKDYNISAVVSVAGLNSAMETVISPAENKIGILAYTGYLQLYLYQASIFGKDMVNLNATESINSTDTPVLIIHGSDDKAVTTDNGSIISHKNEITNPNAQFIICSDDGYNGHTDILKDENMMGLIITFYENSIQ